MPTRTRLVAQAFILAFGVISPVHATQQPAGASKQASHIQASHVQDGAAFQAFLTRLWPEAEKQGISRITFDRALAGLVPDAGIISLTRKQAEFAKPIWSYLDGAVSSVRLARGEAARGEYGELLAALERKYGVDRRIILGIWGMETNFGSYTGDKDVLRSLATLAFVRYRDDFFKGELLAALKLIEAGVLARGQMRGSWAGAMGQTQFMPTSLAKYAVDHDGGGLNPWESVPDALASTANYLASFGWEPGVPWGVEVTLPAGLNLATAMDERPFTDWAAAGLKQADGSALPRKGKARLFFPAGVKGPALLVTPNFKVIKSYNMSDAYALGVAHLGDRVFGEAAFEKPWPRQEKRLTQAETIEMQRRLAAMGHKLGKIDGRIGEMSREAVRIEQAKRGMVADGYPTPAFLARLRAGG
jgi:membrane-bound lytic murein transglycosylase B